MWIKKYIWNMVNIIRGGSNIKRLKKIGLKIGKNYNIQSGCNIDMSHCWLIEIGNDVTFAPKVRILAHDASTKCFLGYTKIGRVSIGNNVFIGASSIVLPGVEIGNNVVIGAGSIVTKNVPSDTVWAGNPAKQIYTLPEYLKKCEEKMKSGFVYNEKYTLRKNINWKKKQEMKEALKKHIGFVE